MKQILVVDDEPRIAAICRDYLRRAGFKVSIAATGADALALARTKQPDLVVLDLGLPRMDGLDVARALRADSNVPIIMLTARVEETDKLLGLELGADDYMTKPFSPRELVARVRAVFRRTELGTARGDVLRAGDSRSTCRGCSVTRGERAIELTPTEFQLLATLVRQPGRVFTRGQLLDAVRGDARRVVRPRDRRARQEHPPQDRARPAQPRYMLTVYGVGLQVRRLMRRGPCRSTGRRGGDASRGRRRVPASADGAARALLPSLGVRGRSRCWSCSAGVVALVGLAARALAPV